jgi:chemotaxis receptor (MCP) glutamine deamidase CheD
MNHFLLPGDVADLDYSTRYGINAMEVLINEMMKLGANRAALKAKIFGGADIFFVNHTMMMVGRKNINFIQRFLETENIPIVGRRMGGHQGIVVHCFTDNFEVFVKPVSMSRFKRTEQAELTFREKLFHEHTDNSKDDITLF